MQSFAYMSYAYFSIVALIAMAFVLLLPNAAGDAQSHPSYATIKEGVLKVNDNSFDIKGICWNPVPKGFEHPEGLAFLPNGTAYDLDYIERDLKLIKDAGFNTLRTYEAVTDAETLKLIQKYGLKVIVPVYNFHEKTNDQVTETILSLKGHPTTLFWEIGNEWNYNHFYDENGSFQQSLDRIQELITLIRALDEDTLLAVNYGELPSPKTEATLDVDIWGLNIYRSDDFRDVFSSWSQLSDKPIYLGEYGADAIDNRNGDGRYAPKEQAYAVTKLTQQIVAQYASHDRGQVLGGTLFAFSDEWWKDGNGSPHEHDIGGIAPGGGPYPDLEFNEEWWGIVDIERNPRPAYSALQRIYKE